MKIYPFLTAIALAVVFFASCSKKKNDTPAPTPAASTPDYATAVSGTHHWHGYSVLHNLSDSGTVISTVTDSISDTICAITKATNTSINAFSITIPFMSVDSTTNKILFGGDLSRITGAFAGGVNVICNFSTGGIIYDYSVYNYHSPSDRNEYYLFLSTL